MGSSVKQIFNILKALLKVYEKVKFVMFFLVYLSMQGCVLAFNAISRFSGRCFSLAVVVCHK